MQRDIELMDEIDRFLLGAMGPSEQSAFEQRLETDNQLREQVEEMKALQKALSYDVAKEKLELLQKVEERLSEEKGPRQINGTDFRQLKKPERHSKILNYRRWMPAAAAAVLLLITAWMVFWNVDDVSLIDEDFVHFPSPLETTRSGGENTFSFQGQAAYGTYEIRDYKAALPLLQAYFEEEGDSTTLFYIGISRLALGETLEDPDQFTRIGRNIDPAATEIYLRLSKKLGTER